MNSWKSRLCQGIKLPIIILFSHMLKTAAVLFRYLYELKGEAENPLVDEICNMTPLLSGLIRQTVETLQIELKINKITDRNNNLIFVF